MNDGLRTDIFLRYRPETIACACIHLAARTIAVCSSSYLFSTIYILFHHENKVFLGTSSAPARSFFLV